MTIFALVLAILGLSFSILALLGYAIVIHHLLDTNHIQIPTVNSIKSETSEEYVKGYNEGRETLWVITQLSLFEMFKDAEIFDFEGSVENILKRMTEINNDPIKHKQLFAELLEYMKGLKDDDISNDY